MSANMIVLDPCSKEINDKRCQKVVPTNRRYSQLTYTSGNKSAIGCEPKIRSLVMQLGVWKLMRVLESFVGSVDMIAFLATSEAFGAVQEALALFFDSCG